MKTMIAVPCMDQVPALFAQSLATLQRPEGTSLALQTGSLIYTSRNALATRAIENDIDMVFWMDSDMVFRPDALLRMIDTMKKNDLEFLTGLYFRRVPPYSPVLFDQLDIDEETQECKWTEFKKIPDGLFEVGGCGFGCVLIKTEVFMDVHGKFGNMFAPIANNGEDIAFCWRARQCGYKIFCDPSVKCGHVGYSVVDEQFFKVFHSS